MDLQDASRALGEITGEVADEEISTASSPNSVWENKGKKVETYEPIWTG